jgi:hypothetical protein
MVESISRDTTLAQVQRSVKSLQLRWKQAKLTLLPLGGIDVPRLVRLLPDKTTTDHLVQVYWETFETIYRILYRPAFWTDYHALWENPLAASADFLSRRSHSKLHLSPRAHFIYQGQLHST